jgi:phospholipid transport system substrate-binding protein
MSHGAQQRTALALTHRPFARSAAYRAQGARESVPDRASVAMKLSIALCLFLFAITGSTKELAPDEQMKEFTDEVIGILKQQKDGQANSQKRADELFAAKVQRRFDFGRMTARAVGSNWLKASEEQQNALTREFRALLTRSFSSALSIYKYDVFEFKPARAAAGNADVTVRIQIKRPGTEPISIDYGMVKTPAGWMVYDVVVAGVNLVTNYRETFNAEIRDHGVDGLITTLANKNRSLESQAGPMPKNP